MKMNKENTMKKLFAIAILTIVSAVSAIAQNGAGEQELIRLQKEWREAIERGDRDALNRFIADDFSNRAGGNKTSQIENSLKDSKERQSNPDMKNFTSTPFDYTVKFKGVDMAVVLHPQANFPAFGGADQFVASEEMKLYFDAGTTPGAFANRNSTTGSGNLIFAISGYLVDMP